MNQQSRIRRIYWVTFWGAAINVILVVLKFIAGILGHSAAMVADAIHSLSDFVTDFVVLIFVRLSNRPKDAKYAYGYGKYETVATALIGLALFVVGIGIMWDSGARIWRSAHGQVLEQPSVLAFWIAIASILLKELSYQFTAYVGRKVDSQAVIANAWHHRSDAFSSIGTAIGIGGAIILGERWRILDPIAAAVVSLFILKVAVNLLRDAFGELTEQALPPQVEQEIIAITSSVEDVNSVHNLRTRRIGSYYAIEMHVRIDGATPLVDAHHKASEIERLLREKFGERTFISVHMEPNK